MTSSEATAGGDALAEDYNELRDDVIKNAGDFEVTAGSANTYTLALDSTITAYAEGDRYRMQINVANTDASTLNINSIGAKDLKKPINQALATGDLEANQIIEVVYNADNDCFDIVAGMVGGGGSDIDVIWTNLQASNNQIYIRRGAVVLCDNGTRLAWCDLASTEGRYCDRPNKVSPFPSNTTNPTGLTISPTVLTRVQISGTDYLIGFATGGTTGYRYDTDFGNESVITVSGTTIVGARRIGYDGTHVYIQDDATNDVGTSVKRFTMAGTTLTYVDTITLGTAPTDTSSNGRQILIGATHFLFFDSDTNANQTIRVYDKSGTQVLTQTFANADSNPTFMHDDAEPTKGYNLMMVGASGQEKLYFVPFNYDAS